jgi:hypothetical protein
VPTILTAAVHFWREQPWVSIPAALRGAARELSTIRTPLGDSRYAVAAWAPRMRSMPDDGAPSPIAQRVPVVTRSGRGASCPRIARRRKWSKSTSRVVPSSTNGIAGRRRWCGTAALPALPGQNRAGPGAVAADASPRTDFPLESNNDPVLHVHLATTAPRIFPHPSGALPGPVWRARFRPRTTSREPGEGRDPDAHRYSVALRGFSLGLEAGRFVDSRIRWSRWALARRASSRPSRISLFLTGHTSLQLWPRRRGEMALRASP